MPAKPCPASMVKLDGVAAGMSLHTMLIRKSAQQTRSSVAATATASSEGLLLEVYALGPGAAQIKATRGRDAAHRVSVDDRECRQSRVAAAKTARACTERRQRRLRGSNRLPSANLHGDAAATTLVELTSLCKAPRNKAAVPTRVAQRRSSVAEYRYGA